MELKYVNNVLSNVNKCQEPVLFYQGNCNSDTARVALVLVSVESALLGYDVEIYHQVTNLLEKKYNCNLAYCYEHPEYLDEILKTLPRNSRYRIIKSIRSGLGEFSYIKPISKFLDVLDS